MCKVHRILRKDQWPTHHRAGLELALRAKRPHNRQRLRFKWADDTVRGVSASYGRWLFWLSEQRLLDATVAPEVLVTPAWVECYILHLEACGNKPPTIRHRISGLERMMAALAPDFDRSWLSELKARYPKTGSHRDKRARIQFADQLIRFAEARCAEADRVAAYNLYRGATICRTALKIIMLSYCPMRLKNLASLRVGCEGAEVVFRDGRWQFDIPAIATKKGNEYNPVLPDRVVKMLEHYLERHRPVLAGPNYAGHALWVTKGGRPQTQSSIRYYISTETKKAIWLRDVAAFVPRCGDDDSRQIYARALPDRIVVAW